VTFLHCLLFVGCGVSCVTELSHFRIKLFGKQRPKEKKEENEPKNESPDETKRLKPSWSFPLVSWIESSIYVITLNEILSMMKAVSSLSTISKWYLIISPSILKLLRELLAGPLGNFPG
jgi:hypothetical protein